MTDRINYSLPFTANLNSIVGHVNTNVNTTNLMINRINTGCHHHIRQNTNNLRRNDNDNNRNNNNRNNNRNDNIQDIIFDIQNVGYTTTQAQQVSLMCKSVYGNPGVNGASDRTITCGTISGATITGLVIQQSIITAGNNFTLEAVVYGYNTL